MVSSRRATFIISSFVSSWDKALSGDPVGCSNSEGGSNSGSPQRSGIATVWSPSERGFFKLNFDGSKLSNGSAALGFVIRDSNGEVLLAGGRSLGCHSSIIQTEVWASGV